MIQVGEWGGLFAGQAQTELGVGNNLLLAPGKLLANARTVQARNDIEIADTAAPWRLGTCSIRLPMRPVLVLISRSRWRRALARPTSICGPFSSCSAAYGFQKFIIVVPSVAIREGVLKNIEITAEHFRALYNNLPFEHFVYDAKKVNC